MMPSTDCSREPDSSVWCRRGRVVENYRRHHASPVTPTESDRPCGASDSRAHSRDRISSAEGLRTLGQQVCAVGPRTTRGWRPPQEYQSTSSTTRSLRSAAAARRSFTRSCQGPRHLGVDTAEPCAHRRGRAGVRGPPSVKVPWSGVHDQGRPASALVRVPAHHVALRVELTDRPGVHPQPGHGLDQRDWAPSMTESTTANASTCVARRQLSLALHRRTVVEVPGASAAPPRHARRASIRAPAVPR